MSEDSSKLLAVKQLTENMDNLAPDGSEIRLLTQVEGGGLVHCTLNQNEISSPVKHKTVEEIWYFISGQGQVWRKLGEQEQVVEVRAGTSLTIPRGTSFQFRNIGTEPLRFIIATIPRWPGAAEAVPVAGFWKKGE